MKFCWFAHHGTALSCLHFRRLFTSAASAQHHKVIIAGGGTGGVTVASRLLKAMKATDIVVVEPLEVHYYQALWTLVGAGIRSMQQSVTSMRDAVPHSIPIIQDRIVHLDPLSSTVHLDGGKKLTYDHLVLSLGMDLRYDLIPGATEALNNDPRVVSNYSALYVEKTFRAYKSFSGGRAVFTLPNTPIKCAGAPQKVMYLFDDYLRRHKLRDSADIVYFTSLPKMFTVDKYSKRLADLCQERNIQFRLRHHLTSVDWTKSEATFENLDTKESQTIQYNMLHITPPMSVPSVLKATPDLGNPDLSDYVNVDAATLRHKKFPNIWSLGDCAALPTSKTTAAISSEAAVLCQNLSNAITGGPGNIAEYTGYTACPIITGYDRGILAEFDYSMNPLETTPLDQSCERYVFYFIKANLLPPLYWNGLLKGIWPGPDRLRRLLHLPFLK